MEKCIITEIQVSFLNHIQTIQPFWSFFQTEFFIRSGFTHQNPFLRHLSSEAICMELVLWTLINNQCRRCTTAQCWAMMTSSNGNIFRVTGHLCGEFTGHRWIPHTKASDAELWCFPCVWAKGWVNNRNAGELRRHRAYYDVTVMNMS